MMKNKVINWRVPQTHQAPPGNRQKPRGGQTGIALSHLALKSVTGNGNSIGVGGLEEAVDHRALISKQRHAIVSHKLNIQELPDAWR